MTIQKLVFVDEVEDEVARLVLDDLVFHLPRALLPSDIREGQWLSIALTPVPAPADESAALRKELGKNDPGGDIKL